MPNGDPDFHAKELPILDRFFGGIEPVLTAFAARRNLAVKKYYHQVPGWDFRFRHPNCGEAYLEVRRVDDETLQILCAWWQDDYDRATRSLRFSRSPHLKLRDIQLSEVLDYYLDEMLTWKAGDWTQVDGGYQDTWHRTWTKETFDSQISHLPTPKT